jgi:hypothetical protein
MNKDEEIQLYVSARDAARLFVAYGDMAQTPGEILSQTTTPNELDRAQDVMILRGISKEKLEEARRALEAYWRNKDPEYTWRPTES